MKKLINPLLVVTLVVTLLCSLCACTSPESEQATESTSQTSGDVDWSVVQEAYTFALPLVLMDASEVVSTNTEVATESKAPINQISHGTHLVDASFTDVVTPNVDTIYSRACLDLSDDALVFHKPSANRFLSIEIMDFYTNSAAILGTGGDTQDECTYLITGPEWTGSVPEGMVQVPIPTNSASLIVRTLIESQEDMGNVAALQEQMHLVPLSAYEVSGFVTEPAVGEASKENDIVPVEFVLSLSCEEFFTRANELMVTNPPTSDDAEILERMATINVGPGLTFDLAALGQNANSEWELMVKNSHDQLLVDSVPFMREAGSWQFFGEPIAEFGTEYSYRALVALDGLGANPVSVAIYPKAAVDSAGEELVGTNSYRIHFEAGQVPPVEQYGFWSITAYNEENFLIDNELNRYSINDRSELLYNEDGSLDILVQAEPPADQSMLGNWLPVSTEQFHLYLRIYLPSASAQEGTWTPPIIEKIAETK